MLPKAPVKKHEMSDRTYVGATPQYRPFQETPYSPVVWIKTHKGVPFRL